MTLYILPRTFLIPNFKFLIYRRLIFNIKILPVSRKFGGIGRILTLKNVFLIIIKNLDLKLIKLIYLCS